MWGEGGKIFLGWSEGVAKIFSGTKGGGQNFLGLKEGGTKIFFSTGGGAIIFLRTQEGASLFRIGHEGRPTEFFVACKRGARNN